MSAVVALVLVPLTVIVVAITMAINTNDPMWLIFGGALAIAAGYIARKTLGN